METTTAYSIHNMLIQNGLERSCESLGFFLKQKIHLEQICFPQSGALNVNDLKSSVNEKDIVLYSQIIGEIKGACYFLLNREEADLILSKSFPGMDLADAKNKTITDAFLLELDNIITASVVTEFSNKLKIKLFGGVPQIHFKGAEHDPMPVLSGGYAIDFNCSYKLDDYNFSPRFIWFFEKKFIEIA